MSLDLAEDERSASFNVRLAVFEGPFDLLLQLISKHKLDITTVALSVVTDEFIAHVREAQATLGSKWSLDQASQFIVVAATLLDLKTARLLPQGEVEDPEDLVLLEARDLLFARLLQYRAFKIVSAWLGQTLDQQSRRFPRPGGLEERYASLLPEIDLTGLADHLVFLAAKAMTPKEPELLSLEHLHVPQVSVREQADVIATKLRDRKELTFRALIADAADRLVVVGRFLAILDLFRNQIVTFEQLHPLGELTVRWLGGDIDDDVGAEFDDDPYVDDDGRGVSNEETANE